MQKVITILHAATLVTLLANSVLQHNNTLRIEDMKRRIEVINNKLDAINNWIEA